jgi:hypothetical protein
MDGRQFPMTQLVLDTIRGQIAAARAAQSIPAGRYASSAGRAAQSAEVLVPWLCGVAG